MERIMEQLKVIEWHDGEPRTLILSVEGNRVLNIKKDAIDIKHEIGKNRV